MPRRSLVLACLVVCVTVAAAADAAAQTSVGAVVGLSHQDAGESDLPSLGPPFGGTSAAIIADLDRRLGQHVTLGGEASFATAISGDQSQRAGSTASNAFTSRHTDTVFSATLKAGLPLDAAVHAAVVVGGGAALRHTTREGTTQSVFPPATRAPFSDTLSDLVFAVTVGADVDVRVSPRWRILAAGRWHGLKDGDRDASGVVRRGVSSSIFRAGVGAQYRFGR